MGRSPGDRGQPGLRSEVQVSQATGELLLKQKDSLAWTRCSPRLGEIQGCTKFKVILNCTEFKGILGYVRPKQQDLTLYPC